MPLKDEDYYLQKVRLQRDPIKNFHRIFCFAPFIQLVQSIPEFFITYFSIQPWCPASFNFCTQASIQKLKYGLIKSWTHHRKQDMHFSADWTYKNALACTYWPLLSNLHKSKFWGVKLFKKVIWLDYKKSLQSPLLGRKYFYGHGKLG